MALHKRAGQSAQQSDLINVEQLVAQYYSLQPQIKTRLKAFNLVHQVIVVVPVVVVLMSNIF